MHKILTYLFAALLSSAGGFMLQAATPAPPSAPVPAPATVATPEEGEERVDTATHFIYYRLDRADYEPDRRNNLSRLEDFIRAYRAVSLSPRVMVTGSASPEGPMKAQHQLAYRRALRARQVLIDAGLEPELVEFAAEVSNGECPLDWKQLMDSVARFPEVPGREEILELYRQMPPVNLRQEMNLRKALMDLQGGRPWNYMLDRFFPSLRYGLAFFEMPYVPEREPLSELRLPYSAAVPAVEVPQVEVIDWQEPAVCTPRYWALKSNLIHDVLLVPNIALEWAFLPQWSVSADYSGAWWGNKYRTHLWRYYGGNLEVKYWFGRLAAQKPLQGWHVGYYGEFASYDFQFGLDGFQGKRAWGTGVIAGYSLPVTEHFNIDFALGIGFFGGRYKRCRYMDGCEVWTGTYFRRWYGPTRGEISLTWLLGCGNVNVSKAKKKGGAL